MEVRFDEKSTKNIVEGYYKKYEDFECSLIIHSNVKEMKHLASRPLPPAKFVDTSFVLKGTLNVDGEDVEVSSIVSHDEIKGVFKTVLENAGYSVKEIAIIHTSDISSTDDRLGFKHIVVDMSTKRKVR